jgi:hypothetical protein
MKVELTVLAATGSWFPQYLFRVRRVCSTRSLYASLSYLNDSQLRDIGLPQNDRELGQNNYREYYKYLP